MIIIIIIIIINMALETKFNEHVRMKYKIN